jgi:hypothetical protein
MYGALPVRACARGSAFGMHHSGVQHDVRLRDDSARAHGGDRCPRVGRSAAQQRSFLAHPVPFRGELPGGRPGACPAIRVRLGHGVRQRHCDLIIRPDVLRDGSAIDDDNPLPVGS